MGNVVLKNITDTVVNQDKSTKNYDKAARLPLQAPGSKEQRILFYFTNPVPVGATVTNATLTWTSEAMPSASYTMSLLRPAVKMAAFNKVTWAKRPTTYIGTTKTIAKSGALVDKTKWVFDIMSDIQSITTGTSWFGYELRLNSSANQYMYGALSKDVASRPVVSITWSDAPDKPTTLSPSGGRLVSIAKPVVRCNYTDVSGSTKLQSVQVQIDASNNFTSPAFDSGVVLTASPELDLSTTSYAGLADLATTYWRMRVVDGAGLSSDWSDVATFSRDAKGTLLITNPASTSQQSDGSVIVEGWTVPPAGLKEFKVLTSAPDINTHIFQNACMDPVTRDIYTTQEEPNDPADNLWISRFAYTSSSDSYAYADRMYLPVGGHGGRMVTDRDTSGSTVYCIFDYAGSQTGPSANFVPEAWVRLPYTAGKTWTSAQALAYTTTKPEYSSVPYSSGYYHQGECFYDGQWYRLNGTSTSHTGKDYLAPYMEILTKTKLVKKVPMAGLGRTNLDPNGTAIGGRCEPEGINVMTLGNWPQLMIGSSINTSSNGYALKLYSYALPYTPAGSIDPNNTDIFNQATDSYVTDSTHPVSWSLTGETQVAYQVFVSQPRINGVSGKTLWDSGKITSTDQTVTVPANIVTRTGQGYRVTVRVWDGKAREATVGDPVYTEFSRDYIYIYSTTVTAPTDLSAVSNAPRPTITLSWSCASAPDAFNIKRNGRVVAVVAFADALIPGSSNGYTWTDNSPTVRKDVKYEVVAVVNDKSSSSNPIITTSVFPLGAWLRASDGTEVLFVNTDIKKELSDQTASLQAIGASSPLIVAQGLQGYSGTLTGELIAIPANYGIVNSGEDWKLAFLALRAKQAEVFYFTSGDGTIEVIAQDMTINSVKSGVQYHASFTFTQVNVA